MKRKSFSQKMAYKYKKRIVRKRSKFSRFK